MATYNTHHLEVMYEQMPDVREKHKEHESKRCESRSVNWKNAGSGTEGAQGEYKH
jgi:hypothetical protein